MKNPRSSAGAVGAFVVLGAPSGSKVSVIPLLSATRTGRETKGERGRERGGERVRKVFSRGNDHL